MICMTLFSKGFSNQYIPMDLQAYNKGVKPGHQTLIGNWQEERALLVKLEHFCDQALDPYCN